MKMITNDNNTPSQVSKICFLFCFKNKYTNNTKKSVRFWVLKWKKSVIT